MNQTNCQGTLALSEDNPPLAINENSTVNYKLALTDPEEDGIASVTILSQQPDNALNATAIKIGDDWYVSVTADYNAAKQNATQDYTITIQSTDTGSPTGVLSNQLPVIVTANNVNGPPVLTVTPVEMTSNEEVLVQFLLSGYDPDAEDITLWITVLADTPNEQNVPITGILNVQLKNAILINETSTSWSLYFIPDNTQNGDYLFKAVLYDRDPNSGSGLTDYKAFSLTVNQVNYPPVAEDRLVISSQDSPADITLIANDADNDPLIYTVIDNPAHGTLSGTAPDLTYTPDAGFSGLDSFTFMAHDGTTDSNIATITIRVNTPPTAESQSVTTVENTAVSITLTAADIDGDSLTYLIVTGPSHGTLSGTAPDLTYTPDVDYTGSDSFTFVANDGTVDSNVATVNITVNAVTIAYTIITLSSSPVLSVFGQPVAFTAVVTAIPPASGIPTGTITFKNGLNVIDTVALTGGTAVISTDTLPVGIHFITAVYNGDTGFRGGMAATAQIVIPNSRVLVKSSLNPSRFGQRVTFTATVKTISPAEGTPTGTVTFRDGLRILGTATLNSSGQATFATSYLSRGIHYITVVYNGDGDFSSSISTILFQAVR